MLPPQHRQYDNQTQSRNLEYKTNFEAHIEMCRDSSDFFVSERGLVQQKKVSGKKKVVAYKKNCSSKHQKAYCVGL